VKLLDTHRIFPKLTKIVSKDQSRPILTQMLLDTEKSVLVGTDSYKLACIPVDVENEDVTGLVPAAILDAFVKAHKKRDHVKPSLHCLETDFILAAVDNRQTWSRQSDSPIGEDALKQFPKTDLLFPEDLFEFEIGLDTKLLRELAEGIGCDDVKLVFAKEKDGYRPSALRPVTVAPMGANHEGLRAIVMPKRIGA